jgi:tape measure domain-containing protein
MATELERLLVRIDATTEGLRRELKRAESGMDSTARNIDKNAGAIEKRFNQIGVAAATYFGARGIQQVIKYSDTFKQLEGRLNTVTGSAAKTAKAQADLLALSQKSGTSIAANTGLYVRLNQSLDANQKKQFDVLKITETVAKSFAITGESAGAMQGAVTQLAQAIASDFKASSQEINSLIDQAPRLAQVVAAELGLRVPAEMKKMAEAGELSTDKFLSALQRGAATINAEYEQLGATVARSLTRLDNAFLVYIGQSNAIAASTSSLSLAIDGLAENFEDVADVALVLGAALSGRYVAALVAARVASFALARDTIAVQVALAGMQGVGARAAGSLMLLDKAALGARGAMALLGGPVGIALTAATAIYAFSDSSDDAAEKTAALRDEMDKASGAADDLAKLNDALAISTGKNTEKTDEESKAIRQNAEDRLESIKIKIMDAEANIKLQQSELGLRSKIAKGTTTDFFKALNLDEETDARAAVTESVKQLGELYKLQNKLNDALSGKGSGGSGNGKGAGGLAGTLDKTTKAADKAKEATNELQDELDKMQSDAVYEAITMGMDDQAKSLYDVELAIDSLEKKYGTLTEAQRKQAETIISQNRSNAARRKEIEDAKEHARLMEQPFINAMENIQDTFADTFVGIFDGSVNSAADAAESIKRIFIRMAAEMATLQIFGAGGLPSLVTGGATAAGGAANAFGGIGNLFSGASSILGKTAVGGAINSFGAAALPSIFGTGAPIGAAVGPMQAGLLGGAGIGLSAIALPVAALALGAIFGNKKPSSKMQTGLADLEEGTILARGGLRGEKFSQENQDMVDALSASAASIAKLFGVVDKVSVAASDRYGFEYARTDDLKVFDTDSPLRNQFKDSAKFLEAVFKDFADEATRKLSDAVKNALPNIKFDDAEQAIKDIEFLQLYEEMVNPISEIDKAFAELEKRFKPVIEQAKRLGLPLDRINELYKEQRDAIEAAHSAQKNADIQNVINDAMQVQITALNEQARAATEFVQRFSRIKDSFTAFLQELTIGQFSPLHPVERLAAMRGQVESLGARAQLGDAEAAEELRELLPAFLELSGEVNGFNMDYAADRDRAEALSRATLSVFTRQVSIQEGIAAAAATQVQVLQDGFNRMIAALQSGRDVFTGGTTNAAGRNLNQVTAYGLTVGQTEAIYRSVTGYTGATGAGQLDAAVAAGGHQAAVIAAMKAAGATGFAEGGSVIGTGGIDTIPAMLTNGEFVMNRSAAASIGHGTLKALNSGNGFGGMEARLDNLTRVVSGLVKVTAESGNINAQMLSGVQGQLGDIQRNSRLAAAR